MQQGELGALAVPHDTTAAVHAPETRLVGWRLVRARALWVLLSSAIVMLFVLGLAHYYDQILSLTNPPVVNNPRLVATMVPDPTAMRDGLHQLGLSVEFYAGCLIAQQVATGLPFVLVGILIFWRKADEPAAWWMSLILVSFLLASPNVVNALAQSIPAWRPFLFAASGGGVGAFLAVFPLIFPDGRFVPRWARWTVVPLLAITGLYIAAPDHVPFLPEHWTVFIQVLAWLLFVGAVIAGPVYRYAYVASVVERQQMKWFVFGTLGTVVGFTVAFVPGIMFPSLTQPGISRVAADLVTGTLIALSFPLIPLSIGVAIMRYRLWDIDVIIRRTLVYGALTASVVGIYVLVVGYLGTALRTGSNLLISLVATGLVAVLFQPLRGWLQHGVNRLLYGQRDDPYGVLARLDTRLALAIPTETVLPTIVETIATALKLPYAAIALAPRELADPVPVADDLAPAAAYGKLPIASTPAPLTRLPLVYGPETVGYLDLAPRPGESSFAPPDRHLLDELATHAGVVVHAVRLSSDLQHARERLVTAREEERRRLRRDLHDGLGPQLASLTLSLAAAREFLTRDPAAADTLLKQLTQQVQDAVADVRRLIYALRPPALDDLGLVAALREQTARYAHGGLEVRVEASPTLAPLPAAIEVAAYRVCLEALANVARHAHARHCTIRLSLDRELTLEVVDDGIGIAPDATAGVGLRSMRERAEELGGSFVVEPMLEGGTCVHARWPLLEA